MFARCCLPRLAPANLALCSRLLLPCRFAFSLLLLLLLLLLLADSLFTSLFA